MSLSPDEIEECESRKSGGTPRSKAPRADALDRKTG
jgi:hypothetical protein